MRLGVVADVHGNVAALETVVADAAPLGIDAWWALGDLVLFGPRPVETLELLASLPDVAYVRGNTDRYVLTGEQPHPHRTTADIVDDPSLIERYVGMTGAIAWTRGALVQAGLLDQLRNLPNEQRHTLADGTTLLGVHASPGQDDSAGISPLVPDGTLAGLLQGCGASVVVGGHTHRPTDRTVGDVRALNAGSVGIPERPGQASWMVIDTDGPRVAVEHRRAPFDVDAVIVDLHARGYPNAPFVETVLDGTHGL